VVATAEDGELYFGGMNGVSSFYPSAISSFEEQIKILITTIRVNNTGIISDAAVWNINNLTLNYDQNSLSFDFIAMANNNPNQYIYQYRMLGIDKEWIQNSGIQTVRYSLPPGKYTLQVSASRSFDKDATPMKEIKITIRPPFWKSWWFLSLTAISFISLLAYFINQKNKKKFAEKIQQIENERRLKEERERISRDLHDSLGAYANAVLYNTELLEKENTDEKRKELIGDLKFASKDIITSLRETVWALKKESYTAEETFVRIRNFIQPLTRYYSHIRFRIDGEAPADVELPYSKALNLVRIVQEAVTNSIKHANPGDIIVSSKIEENKWLIRITDNGKGFDYAIAKKAEEGNGLNNMQQRAVVSGFTFTTDSTTNKGTTVSIIV
jgi:signal transduction histidine kinase